jgi:hypothetical protein
VNYVAAVAKRIKEYVPEEALPSDDVDLLFLMYAVLLLAKGPDVACEDVHDAWTAWMTARGEDHESMVPFGELPTSVQDEDAVFLAAIRRASDDVQSNRRPIR